MGHGARRADMAGGAWFKKGELLEYMPTSTNMWDIYSGSGLENCELLHLFYFISAFSFVRLFVIVFSISYLCSLI